MFANEASVLRRMLDSTLGFCDFYLFQDNGSTDGSDAIAKQFLIDNNLRGHVYKCEEGWKGFGWNRDHLIRYCQTLNHGCDWILKMDCDEVLQVDDNFDWDILNDFSIDSFHIPAVAGSTMYKRCWMWNANRKWAFHHDPCHEIIYSLDMDPSDNESFYRHDLPATIRQVGLNEGQSWGNPTKFVTDSLKLEEQMIADGSMTDPTRNYHFWYIGKSYFDAFGCTTFPLGEEHQKEYARRSIWYFQQWYQHTFNGNLSIDESAYNAFIFIAIAQRFLGEIDAAIESYQYAAQLAPPRNDHLIGLAECYRETGQYQSMRAITQELLHPSRKNPYPLYSTFIDTQHYVDTGSMPQILHNEAVALCTSMAQPVPFIINKRRSDRMFIVDDFYANPDQVREYALTQVQYEQDLRWYKGYRSTTTYKPEGLQQVFESIIGEKIVDFNSGYNGVFQIMMSADQQVYHFDTQKWAAMIYLTPGAPIESGTRLHRSRHNLSTHRDQGMSDQAFKGDFYDATQFDVTDSAANIYNRLVIMDAGCYHSAGPYFGNTLETGRLTHLFFFD